MAAALNDTGVESSVAVGRLADAGIGPIDDHVRERGLEPITRFRLPKHRRLGVNRRDAARLLSFLQEFPVEIVHTHLDNAHRIAMRAIRRLPASLRPLMVRSLYDGAAPRLRFATRQLYTRSADGVFVFGEGVRNDVMERFSLPPERVVRLEGGVVTERFRPRTDAENLRDRFEIPQDAIVVGIVARIQLHRRYEILLEAVKKAMAAAPRLHLLVLGRGTRAKEIAHRGVERLGIGQRVRLPGYVGGDDYPRALACFDFKVFLVPGSDGTCRAVREAMATGVPLIVSKRGMLPEMIRHEKDGLVVDDEVEPLAAAIERLATDDDFRKRLGANALKRAHDEFDQRRQAERVRDAYQVWTGRRAVSG